MTAATTIQHTIHDFIYKEIRPDWQPPIRLNWKLHTYTISPYALDAAILWRVEHVIDFFIEIFKGRPELNFATSGKKLTPLHIAVMTDDFESARKLVTNGAEVNMRDKQGWTPLHHAALKGNAAMQEFLLSMGADPEIRTLDGGTYANILKLASPLSENPDAAISLLHKMPSEELAPLTQREFKELTSAVYIDEHVIGSKKMWAFWLNHKPLRNELVFASEFKESYLEWIKTPTLHLLDRMGVIPGQLGLFATRHFKPKELLTEYKGAPYNGSLNEYVCKDTDCKDLRNEAAQINDGFINTVAIPLHHTLGLPSRLVFAAADTIEAGDQFCWNYGRHSVKYGPYIELRPKAVRDFIKKESDNTRTLISLLAIIGSSGELTFEDFVRGEKFRYILSTPSVLFAIALEGDIPLSKLKELHRAAYMMDCISDSAPENIKNMPEIIKRSLEIKTTSLKDFPHSQETYFKRITTLSRIMGIAYVLQIVDHVNKTLTRIFDIEKCLSPEDDKIFATTLNKSFDAHIDKVLTLLKSKE